MFPKDRKPGQEGIGLHGFADAAPIREGSFRPDDRRKGVQTHEPARGVVIGIVPGFLENKKTPGDPDDLILERQTVQSGNELRRNLVIGELPSDVFHGRMGERPRHAAAQRRPGVPGEHARRRFADQQVI